MNGSAEIVKLLIAAGLNVNIQHPVSFYYTSTALDFDLTNLWINMCKVNMELSQKTCMCSIVYCICRES